EFLANKAASVIAEFPDYSRLNPDGKTILAVLRNRTVVFVDLEGKQIGAPIYDADNLNYNTPEFTADGKHILIGTSDPDAVRMYDLLGNLVAHLADFQPGYYKPLMLTSADGQWIIAGGRGTTMRLWDSSGRATGVDFHHDSFVNNALITPDSKTLITSSRDGIVRIWDLEGKQIGETSKLQHSDSRFRIIALDVSPDSQWLVTGAEGIAQVWDMQGNAVGAEMEVPLSTRRHNIQVEFSQDGQTILTSGHDSMRLWNRDGSPKGEVIRQLRMSDAQLGTDAPNVIMITNTGGPLRLLERDGRPLGTAYFGEEFTQSFQYVPGEQSVLLYFNDPSRPGRGGDGKKNYLVPLPLRNADRIVPSSRCSLLMERGTKFRI
ncbi:MAG: WD40 repeat domain-containing protein, partial [Acidobacteria bacterium]|nr:WD40 repeat domain-containing protein [Acidobacteriota bacterium]